MKSRTLVPFLAFFLLLSIAIPSESSKKKFREDKLYGPNNQLLKTTRVDKRGRTMQEIHHLTGEVRFFGYTNTNIGWVQTSINLYMDTTSAGATPQLILTHKIFKNRKGSIDYVEQNNEALAIIEIEKLPDLDSTNLSANKTSLVEHLTAEIGDIKEELTDDLEEFKRSRKDGELDLTQEEFDHCLRVFRADFLRLEQEIESFRQDLMQVDFTIITKSPFHRLGRAGDPVIVLKNELSPVGTILKEVRFSPWTGEVISEKTFERGLAQKTFLFDEEGNKYPYAEYEYGASGSNLLVVNILDRDGTVNKRIFTGLVPVRKIRVSEDKWVGCGRWPDHQSTGAENLNILLGHKSVVGGYAYGTRR